VIAKRIDAGLEEPEHGLVSKQNRGQGRIRKRCRTPRRKRRSGRRNERKAATRGAALAADASASGYAALSRRSGSPRVLHAFGGGARVGSRRSRDVVESNSFRLPQVRANKIPRACESSRDQRTYTSRQPKSAQKLVRAANSRKGVARRRHSPPR